MSQNIIKELDFFLQAMLLGIMIAVFYDTIRIFRRVFRHGVFWIAMEDFFFWFICCLKIFEMFIKENSGTLRWFAIAANAAGMLLYCKTLSRFYVTYVSKLLNFLLHVLVKVLTVAMKPFHFVFGRLKKAGAFAARKSGKGARYVKNRLTRKLKLFIITLCKR